MEFIGESEIGAVSERMKLRNSRSPAFPWFGLDIGGSLVKLVYFEPHHMTAEEEEELGSLRTICSSIRSDSLYRKCVVRDAQLELRDLKVCGRDGTLHFLRFQTADVTQFLAAVRDETIDKLHGKVCATGGGAYKFEEDFRTVRLKGSCC